MPILIRIIAQRLVVFVFGVLAFFGINPDLSIPTSDFLDERKSEQQELVQEVLSVPDSNNHNQLADVGSKPNVVENIEIKTAEIEKKFTENIAEPLVETVKSIAPVELVYEPKEAVFNIQDVVVNIICLEKTNAYTKLSTGSGVVISSKGLILTNAHVTYPYLRSAQFGFSDYSCSVRRENIPNFGYNAELVYYPIDWLEENKFIVQEPAPIGTGENDYALLQITSGIGPTKVGDFSYALTDVEENDLKRGLFIVAAGYPSSNSGVFEIDTRPGLKIADTTIVDYFTFGNRSFDVLQTGNNIVAKRGSSGGGIFSGNSLYGIVVTTNANDAGAYINALTLPYIKKDFYADTGINFESFGQYSIDSMRAEFNVNKNKIKNIISGN